MRHGKKFNHLGRTAPHRNAMLSNMAGSLIISKRITTTVAKAKALRKYVEPLLTKSKDDTTHSRRVVFSSLKNKEVLKELFDEVAAKIADRPGGYTRIIKLGGTRLGDNAEMALIELVDYNENLLGLGEKKEKKKTTRRSRSGGADAAKAEGTKPEAKETKAEAPKKETKTEAPKAEAKKEEAKKEEAPKAKKEEPKSDDKSDEKKQDE